MFQSNGSPWTPPTGVPRPRPPHAASSGQPVKTRDGPSPRTDTALVGFVSHSWRLGLTPSPERRPKSDLVGADDEHDAFHVGLRAHFLLHLPQPAVEGIETLPEAHVVHQQHPLAVLVELVPHLRGENKRETITTDVERRQRSG